VGLGLVVSSLSRDLERLGNLLVCNFEGAYKNATAAKGSAYEEGKEHGDTEADPHDCEERRVDRFHAFVFSFAFFNLVGVELYSGHVDVDLFDLNRDGFFALLGREDALIVQNTDHTR